MGFRAIPDSPEFRRISRRRALQGLAVAVGMGGGGFLRAEATPPGLAEFWPVYRARFVESDGRVVDSFQNGASHSESQGWGLLLAAAAGDWDSFDRIWAWTAARLLWRGAALFAWRWDPAAGAVADVNNASDGDILIAWALARAGRRRGRADLTLAARRSAAAIRRLLTVDLAPGLAVLPGFQERAIDGAATLNLSYFVFPAFPDLAEIDPDPAWARLTETGLTLARGARFGRHGLPPDWLAVAADGGLAPAPGRPARFGYDAVRLPLYLVWAGHDAPALLDACRRAWRVSEPPPAWFALAGGGDAGHGASAGVLAIRDLIEGRRPLAATVWSAVREGAYYAASLALLATLAATERQDRR